MGAGSSTGPRRAAIAAARARVRVGGPPSKGVDLAKVVVMRDEARRLAAPELFGVGSAGFDKAWSAIEKDDKGRTTYAALVAAYEEHERSRAEATSAAAPAVPDAAAASASETSGGAGGPGKEKTTRTIPCSDSDSVELDQVPSAGASRVVAAAAGYGAGLSVSDRDTAAATGPKSTSTIESSSSTERVVTTDVPLTLRGRTYVANEGTVSLLSDPALDNGEAIIRACTRFYEKMFLDSHISKFVFLDDGAERHGERLALWIIEKMGGGDVWTSVRPPDSRQRSHSSAWHSKNREPSKRGRRFKLDDCRVWMRCFFWAFREEGLLEHAPFARWLTQFISHFIRVYEFSAPPYTQESVDWSADPGNVDVYLRRGRAMLDVIDVGVKPW